MKRTLALSLAVAIPFCALAHDGIRGHTQSFAPATFTLRAEDAFALFSEPMLATLPFVGAAFVNIEDPDDGSWTPETLVDTNSSTNKTHKVVHVTTYPGLGTSQPYGSFVFSWNKSPHTEKLFTWNPLTGAISDLDDLPYNPKCAAHIGLDDDRGSVLFYGGTRRLGDAKWPEGEPYGRLFNPQGSSGNWYQTAPTMAYNRWYPGATRLPDGRIFLSTGEDGNGEDEKHYQNIPELYLPPQKASGGAGNIATLPFSSTTLPMETDYPYLIVSPYDGNLLFLGPQGYKSDHSNRGIGPTKIDTLSWACSSFGSDPNDIARTTGLFSGSFVLVDGVFYKSGGYVDGKYQTDSPTGTVGKLDCNQANPTWQSAGSFTGLSQERAYHYMIALADGSILAIGGSTLPSQFPAYVREPQQYKPWDSLAGWKKLNGYSTSGTYAGHGYHSVAFLLPDGRVMLVGGQKRNSPTDSDPDVSHIFTPPYLANGKDVDRPVITSAPTDFIYGGAVTMTATYKTGRTISKYTLVAMPSPTHAVDNNQRLWTLSPGTGGTWVVPNSFQCPPGWYMLFAIDSAGVPSIAKYVRVWDKLERVYPVAYQANGVGNEIAPTPLLMGDNSYATVPTQFDLEPYTSIMLVHTVPPSASGITAIRVKVEVRHGTAVSNPVYLKLYLKDFTNSTWVPVDSQLTNVTTTTSDARYEAIRTSSVENNFSRFIQPFTGRITAKV